MHLFILHVITFGATLLLSSCGLFSGSSIFPYRTSDGQVGFVSGEGEILIKPSWKKAGYFREGLAPVQTDSGWGYVDTEGKMQLAPVYEAAQSFSCGLARVRAGGLFGYIDAEGNWKIPASFQEAQNFRENLALVSKDGERFYINTSGVVVIPRVRDGGAFHEGYAAVLYGKKWGFMDASGNMLPKAAFVATGYFSDGLAPVKTDSGWGYIDDDGDLEIEGKYEQANNFSHGMAAVKIAGKWGFVDDDGDELPAIYAEVKAFGPNGLAPVFHKGRWGYINRSGKLVIPPAFGDASPFRKEGGVTLAWVKGSWRWGYVDSEGQAVFDLFLENKKRWKERSKKLGLNLVKAIRGDYLYGGGKVQISALAPMNVKVKKIRVFRKGEVIIGTARVQLKSPADMPMGMIVDSDLQAIYLLKILPEADQWNFMKTLPYNAGKLGKRIEDVFREVLENSGKEEKKRELWN